MKKIILSLILIVVVCCSFNTVQARDYKEALKEMLELGGYTQTLEAFIPQVISGMKKQFKNVPANAWTELEKEVRTSAQNDLVDLLVPVYQKHLTQDDLEAVVSFYKTPAGKKLGQAMPSITQETMQVAQVWGMQLGFKLQQKIKEKGY